MTLKECIDIVDNNKPNQYTIKEKVMWLSFIEEIIINEVLKTHEGYDGRYTQDITDQLAGLVTPNSKIDLQPTPEQLYSFQTKDVTFTTVNEGGNVRVCAIGTRPANTYENIQITITEVATNE